MKKLLLLIVSIFIGYYTNAQNGFSETYPSVETTHGRDVVQTSDGSYLILGDTVQNNGEEDIYLLKTDSIGQLLWTKSFGLYNLEEVVLSIEPTLDGNFVVAGGVKNLNFSGGYPFVYKIDEDGNFIWEQDSISSVYGYANDIIATPDSGYLITSGADGNGMSLVKLDSLGEVEWTKFYGNTWGDVSGAIAKTFDNGYLIQGRMSSLASEDKIALIKIDSNYNTEWTKYYGGEYNTVCYDFIETTDTNYLLTGRIGNADEGYKVLLMKINQQGDSLWSKSYGQGGANNTGNSIEENSNGDLIVVGNIANASIFKLSSEGDSISSKMICYGYADKMIKVADDFVVTGAVVDIPNDIYTYLVKADSSLNFEDLLPSSTFSIDSQNKIQVFPNPFNNYVDFHLPNSINHLYVYSLTGKLIRQTTKYGSYRLNRDQLPKGIYLYKIISGDNVYSGKIVAQ